MLHIQKVAVSDTHEVITSNLVNLIIVCFAAHTRKRGPAMRTEGEPAWGWDRLVELDAIKGIWGCCGPAGEAPPKVSMHV